MKKRRLSCIIGMAVLMLLSVFLLSGCTKKKKEDQKDTDVKENLQVEESVDEEEGPSVNFEDVFLNENKEGLDKAEFFLPTVVTELIKENRVQVEVINSDAVWYGMTYKEDKEVVKESFNLSGVKSMYVGLIASCAS